MFGPIAKSDKLRGPIEMSDKLCGPIAKFDVVQYRPIAMSEIVWSNSKVR